MKFLLDAQLPRRLSRFIQEASHDAIHTLDLPNRNETSDTEILKYSIEQDCVLITKDHDFVNTFLVSHRPNKLLLVSTGNIRNRELEELFSAKLDQITILFQEHHFIEIGKVYLLIHQ